MTYEMDELKSEESATWESRSEDNQETGPMRGLRVYWSELKHSGVLESTTKNPNRKDSGMDVGAK